MLLDTRATNSFMRPECAQWLGLEVEQTATGENEFCQRFVSSSERGEGSAIQGLTLKAQPVD
jgi:hypothetical protein